jgi:hypothetical protein
VAKPARRPANANAVRSYQLYYLLALKGTQSALLQGA